MAVSVHYQTAVDMVDPTKVLTYTVDTTYEDMEWSYSGLAVTGGSELACGLGASALLEEMGFRFYAPPTDFWKLPATIPTDLVAEKQTFWIPGNNIFLVYGHSWSGTNGASRTILNDRQSRWAALTGANISSYPAGHRWNNIIVNSTAFFTANPQLLKPLGIAQTFNIDGIVGTPDYDLLVEYCAAFMLNAGFNQFGRTHFDPADGDQHSSDLIYPFTLAVATKIREGTSAIGTFAAQAGVPDAQIGIYAYAGHRLPPTDSYTPGVYTQVALAFNSSGLTYDELIQQHGAKADAIAIREYLDTQTWSQGRPFANGRAKDGYLVAYNNYQDFGVKEVNSEFTANWLVNMAFARAALLKFRTGEADYATVIPEMVNDIFDGDPKVQELYELWQNPLERYHKFSLRASFDIVDAMADGWYKQYFKQLMTILYLFHRCENYDEYGITRSGVVGDAFSIEITKLLSWVTALRETDIMHGYAFIRQQANSRLNDYPTLKFNYLPEPSWFATPVAPTDADYTALYATLVAETERDPALDGTDLVLRVVTPVAAPVSATGNNAPATEFYCEGVAIYVVIGPAVVTITGVNPPVVDSETGDVIAEDGETTTTLSYGRGVHSLGLSGDYTVTWSSGYVFLDTFPYVRKDPGSGLRRHWIYIQPTVADQVDLEPESRWSFFDEEVSRKDWTPSASFPSLGPGQVAVDDNNTRGNMTNGNCNRYLSPVSTLALMTRELATRGGSVSVFRVVDDPEPRW